MFLIPQSKCSKADKTQKNVKHWNVYRKLYREKNLNKWNVSVEKLIKMTDKKLHNMCMFYKYIQVNCQKQVRVNSQVEVSVCFKTRY